MAIFRLRSIARWSASATPAPAPALADSGPLGIGGAFVAEWRRVLAVRGAFIMLVIAPMIYGMLMDHGEPRSVFLIAAACSLLSIGTVVFGISGRSRE